jgi:hypothetical protein
MHKVFKLREWVKNVQQGKAVWPFVSSIWRYDKDTDERLQMKADLLDTSFLLQYHNEIKKLSDWFPKYFHPTYGWRAINIDYNDIKTLCLLNEAINKGKENTEKPWWIGMEHDYYYRSYDTYTLTNFWHRLKENKIVLTYYAICMVPIVAASISRFIELNYCKKILTESDVSANKDAIVFNEWLKAKVQKIDPDILPYTRIEGHKSIIEPYYSWSDFFKKDSPLFLVLPSVSILTERVEQIPFYQNNFFGFLVANVTVMPIVSYCALKPIAWLLSELPLSEFFYLSSYVTAFFCGCALGITLLNMRLWRRQEVSLSDLPAILKKCDDGLIVIEEKQ